MAKKLIDWNLTDKGVIELNQYNSDKDAKVITEATFDLNKIYTNFSEFTPVQKYLTYYGAKQLMADIGASIKGDLAGKVVVAKELWACWVGGKTRPERANATGAAENRKVASTMKTASKVVSLEGLIAKKLLAENGVGEFTKTDQKKLAEFLKVAGK